MASCDFLYAVLAGEVLQVSAKEEGTAAPVEDGDEVGPFGDKIRAVLARREDGRLLVHGCALWSSP